MPDERLIRWPSPRFARLGQLIGLNADRTPIHMDAHQIIKLKTCETSKTSSTFFRVTIFRVFELTPWAFLRERVLCRWRVSALEVSNKSKHFSPTNRLAFLHEILLIAAQLAQQCPALVLVAWLAVTIKNGSLKNASSTPHQRRGACKG